MNSELEPEYSDDTYEIELRYYIPRLRCSEESRHGKFEREILSQGTAICEITECAVPYVPLSEMMDIYCRVKGLSV